MRPRLTVFTGSRFGADPQYADAAAALGHRLAQRGVGLVYGGGHVGLMRVVADAAVAAGGEVIGVIPEHMVEGEDGHDRITRLEIVADMHARKTRMAELGDAFLAMPGGIGTLEELFEIWAWRHLGLHQGQFGVYDVGDFWQPLLQMAQHMVETGFLSEAAHQVLHVFTTPDDVIDGLLSRR